MSTEILVLALAALLQGAQFAAFSVAANLQVGPRRALGPRDEAITLTGTAGRLQRALNNHFEGLILFAIACLVVEMSETASALTATCAWLYLSARVLYVPAYAFGWVPWRSIIWCGGFAATILMILAAVLA